MNTLTVPTQARHADLGDLVEMLRTQADVRYDVVAPASKISYDAGLLAVEGGGAVVTDEGVETRTVRLNPTRIFESGISEKLGVPGSYLRRMREVGKLDLLDHNVNEWLGDEPRRQFLVRGFRTDGLDEVGIARAFLSDTYRPIDNLDVLMSALAALKDSGLSNPVVYDGNITETRMSVRMVVPEINRVADAMLDRYRSPFGDDGPPSGLARLLRPYGNFSPRTVFAGIELSNSETGGGAFYLKPTIQFIICGNGMTRKADTLREVHLGGKLAEGPVAWSAETQERAVALVMSKTKDAIRRFLSPEYLDQALAEVEESYGVPVSDPVETIERISRAQGFTLDEQRSILDFFVRSGDPTAGGVMQAVTATAQVVESPDRQTELQDTALDVLAAAAA